MGDPNGKLKIPAETDASIRPGWFYHPEEDSKVRSGKDIADLYYKSVGRNSLLLLNIPPNPKGLFADQDVKSLNDFRVILDDTFRTNLAAGKATKHLTDNKLSSYITLMEKQPFVLDFKTEVAFDRDLFQENIAGGQRNIEALLEYWNGKDWQKGDQFTTIGYKRLLRFPLVKTSKVRVMVLDAKQSVHDYQLK